MLARALHPGSRRLALRLWASAICAAVCAPAAVTVSAVAAAPSSIDLNIVPLPRCAAPSPIRQTTRTSLLQIVLQHGWFIYPFSNTVGDKVARMLKRDDVRTAAHCFLIADRQ